MFFKKKIMINQFGQLEVEEFVCGWVVVLFCFSEEEDDDDEI